MGACSSCACSCGERQAPKSARPPDLRKKEPSDADSDSKAPQQRRAPMSCGCTGCGKRPPKGSQPPIYRPPYKGDPEQPEQNEHEHEHEHEHERRSTKSYPFGGSEEEHAPLCSRLETKEDATTDAASEQPSESILFDTASRSPTAASPLQARDVPSGMKRAFMTYDDVDTESSLCPSLVDSCRTGCLPEEEIASPSSVRIPLLNFRATKRSPYIRRFSQEFYLDDPDKRVRYKGHACMYTPSSEPTSASSDSSDSSSNTSTCSLVMETLIPDGADSVPEDIGEMEDGLWQSPHSILPHGDPDPDLMTPHQDMLALSQTMPTSPSP